MPGIEKGFFPLPGTLARSPIDDVRRRSVYFVEANPLQEPRTRSLTALPEQYYAALSFLHSIADRSSIREHAALSARFMIFMQATEGTIFWIEQPCFLFEEFRAATTASHFLPAMKGVRRAVQHCPTAA
jgi:hypothetical protein